MAEKLLLDTGLLELEINDNGVLRFNPSDVNVYQRFYAFAQKMQELEKEYATAVEDKGDEFELAGKALDKAREIDQRIKRELSEVFGAGNDFDALTGGVNLMAFGRDGERVITNLLNALSPYLEKGIKRHMQGAAESAVAEAKKNRARRRIQQ